MPKIPEYVQRTQASGAFPQVDSGLTRAIGQEATEFFQVRRQQREQDAAVWATEQLSNAQVQWSQEFVSRQQGDVEDFTGELLRDFDEFTGALSAQAPTRDSRSYLKARLSAYRATLAQNSLNFEAKERAAKTVNTANSAIDSGRILAYQNPEQYSELLAERVAAIDVMRLDPETKRQLTDSAQQQMAAEAVRGMIDTDPASAIVALRQPFGASGNLAIETLTADDRSRLMESAERKRIAQFNAQQLEAEEALTLIEDRTSKTGDRLLANGELDSRWIENNRDNLSAEDYRYFYRALSGGENARDPLRYAELREQASFGADVRLSARQALQQGSITVSDYNALLNEVESSRPNWFSRGTQYIATSAAVSDINPDPAAAQRKAVMLDDWADWANRNPDASDTEAREAYRRIVNEYAIIDMEEFLITKRQPRFMVGGRSNPDMQATKQATRDAWEKGLIDDQELDLQIQLITEWENAMRSFNE